MGGNWKGVVVAAAVDMAMLVFLEASKNQGLSTVVCILRSKLSGEYIGYGRKSYSEGRQHSLITDTILDLGSTIRLPGMC